MTDQQEPTGQLEPNRLTMAEFLTQLDTAAEWMLWVNPAFEEVELIVKDADGKLTAFHGPEPMSVGFDEYKKFCAEVDRISSQKERHVRK